MNTPKEFLEELAEELRYLPAKEVNEVLKHYKEKINVEIDYGTPLDKIFSSLKSPKEIAENIYKMHGVDYILKRKKKTKIKNNLIAILSGLIIIACLLLFIVGAIFIGNILINQISLIIYSFNFNNFLDTEITTILVLAYFFVMVIVCVYIIDLFIILINSLLIKIFNAFEKTRGKYYSFMDFTITGFFNQVTKIKKFLLKVMGICALVFVIASITSYFTKGYMYRSLNNINSSEDNYSITEKFNEIYIDAINTNVTITEIDNITDVQIKYEYELTNMNYEVTNNKLNITVDKFKTYDIFGFIKASIPHIFINVPTGYDLTNILLKVDYGTVTIKNLKQNSNLSISTISGNILLGENKLSNTTLTLHTGNINSNKNVYNQLTIDQSGGKLNAGEDVINELAHTNEASQIIIVNSTISDYLLKNSSGSVYLEKITGKKLDMLSNTAINKLFDLYYEEAIIIAQNTANLMITRSCFEVKLQTFSLNNSYQTLEYIKSKELIIGSNGGLITCNKINYNYELIEIDKLEESYKQYAHDYNNYEVDDTKIFIESAGADLSIEDLSVTNLKIEMENAATVLVNLFARQSEISFINTAATINEYYCENVEMIVKTTKITTKSSIDIVNEADSKLIINLYADGVSEFVTSENITVNLK